MIDRVRHAIPPTALLLFLVTLSFTACGGDAGLSRAEVEEIVRDELAAQSDAGSESSPSMTSADVEKIINDAIADIPQPDPGLTLEDVERVVNAAVADIPQPEPGLTRDEVEAMVNAGIAAIPTKAAPSDYTKFLVDGAIASYERYGLEATLDYYNRPESVDGQWYVFIVDENDIVIGHPDSERRGLDLKGWVGTDANGYEFGPDMLAATEDGKWVSYVYRNPASGGVSSGEFELKNVWVERRDGLLFASGWYIAADKFTQMLVATALDRYREGGLAATTAYFASPGNVLAGLEAAVDYYNDAETVDGRWFAFIGDPSGKIAAHSDPSMIGGEIAELLGGEVFDAGSEGMWVASESLRVWVASYDGHVFGSGWSQ